MAKGERIGNRFCLTCGMPLILGGRYVAQRVLGQGGFGITYLAQDLDIPGKRQCVIKQFQPDTTDPDLLATAEDLFKREAVVLTQLGEHPQIPSLLAFFQERAPSVIEGGGQQYFYLVQEFIDGETLADELEQQGRFSEEKVRHVLKELLPVLDYIHQKGVIHRDIKPTNIMRQSSENSKFPGQQRLYLIDFGAVKQISQVTQVVKGSTRIYTEHYAAPEQARGERVFPSSDLYALAVTCLVLLTGKQPEDLFDPYHHRWRWQHYAHVSLQLEKVLERMLAINPNDRYQSAREVEEALKNKPKTPFPLVLLLMLVMLWAVNTANTIVAMKELVWQPILEWLMDLMYKRTLKQDEAIELLHRWFRSKPEIFGRNYNLEPAHQLLTGSLLNDVVDKSIPFLQTNNAYYVYQNYEIESPPVNFRSEERKAEITFKVYETAILYQNNEPLNQISTQKLYTYTIVYDEQSNSWKISDTFPSLLDDFPSLDEGSILDQDEAVELLHRWFSSKPDIFGYNYNLTPAYELLTGSLLNEVVDKSIPWLKNNNAYYTYQDYQIDSPPTYFYREVGKAEITVNIREVNTLHQKGKPPNQTSVYKLYTYTIVYDEQSNSWKISSVVPASPQLGWKKACGSTYAAESYWWPVRGPSAALSVVKEKYCGDALIVENQTQAASFRNQEDAEEFATLLSQATGYRFYVGEPKWVD
ncbi:IMS domain-containing protein [Thermosynechococcaceae cyanobacterium Okahandja]